MHFNLSERADARWMALRLLCTTFPRHTATLAGACLLRGAVPAAFAIAVGGVVSAIPDAARDGLDSVSGHRLGAVLGIAAVILLVGEAVGMLCAVLTVSLYRLFDEAVLARVMRAVLAPAGIGHLEDPEQQQRIALALRAARFGPGEFVSGISAKWQAQATGVAGAVLVATINLPAALILCVIWLVVGVQVTTSRYRAYPYWSEPLKRALYLRDLGLEPHAAKEVRLFGLADWLLGQYTSDWRHVMQELWVTRRSDFRLASVLVVLLAVTYFAVLNWGAMATSNGDLSQGQLAVLFQAMFAMAGLGSLAGDVWVDNGAVPIPSILALEHELAPLADQVKAHGSLRSMAAEPNDAAGVPGVRDRIRFEAVRFVYPRTSHPVLDGFELEIPSGHSLAVVGANGAGKTTLLKLLLGLYQPLEGRISIDGTPLDQLDLTAWRRKTAVIFQDFVRYELSARDNIGFGCTRMLSSASTTERLQRSAERADALRMIEALPRGFDTPLSRRFAGGVELSGGQWQRIALARALFAVEGGATLLMLDEPTAHLDVRAEVDLFDRFLELTAGLTTIVVSHRFSTVRRADRIAVIHDGRIAEVGTHAELLARAGYYARMFRAQAATFHA